MITFKNVGKSFNSGFEALKDINLQIDKGELVALIGPSGCGKTTTMKMINRLIEPSKGKILIDGKDISNQNPVELRRNIGYVIQQVGLLPHMTIEENISLVPRLKGWKKDKYEERIDELLELVGLEPATFKKRYPSELSGGQQQRIGVIRALAAEPSIILMDEPFSALDPISREQLQDELVRLQNTIKKTIVFVTHDMDEAIKIANRIAIMKDGQIIQFDTPENIWNAPANDFVRNFFGDRYKPYGDGLLAKELMMNLPESDGANAIQDSGISVSVLTPSKEVAEIFATKNPRSIFVVDGERKVGVITQDSLIKGIAGIPVKDSVEGGKQNG